MADSWDSDAALSQIENFAAPKGDKWMGEDEEDDVKDSWEDEDAEEKGDSSEEKSQTKAFQRKKKKPLAERIAEKEALRLKAEQEEKEKEKEAKKEITPEEKLAEKLRVQKIQEESDLKLAKEAFGVSSEESKKDGNGIDAMNPETEEDFVEFEKCLKNKITEFEKSKHYPGFLEKLFTDLCLGIQLDDIKNLGTLFSKLYHERQRLQKEDTKKKKKKVKVNLRVDNELADMEAAGGTGEYFEDYDEYM